MSLESLHSQTTIRAPVRYIRNLAIIKILQILFLIYVTLYQNYIRVQVCVDARLSLAVIKP